MSIFLDRQSRVVVQGITGRMAQFHTKEMLDYGTNVVAGVVPGKGGETVFGVPVFDTVKQAVEATGADASLVFVPPPFAADSIMEAADGGIRYCVCITDGIPAQDMIRVKRYMMRYPRERRMVLTGPNCAGTISPGKALLGIMPGHIYLPGHVGIVGRSGTLGYEAAQQLMDRGIGVSTSVGIGGFPLSLNDRTEPAADSLVSSFFGPSSGACSETLKLQLEIDGVATAVRFRDGQILAPIAFTGSYNPPLIGCVDFAGVAQTSIVLELDKVKQALVGRAAVREVNLSGSGGIGGSLLARMVQSSIDRKINPINILQMEKVSFAVPIQNSGTLRMRASGIRHEIAPGALNVVVTYDFQ